MGNRYCLYKIPLPLGEVIDKTTNFWANNRGTVKDHQIDDKGVHTLFIKHKATASSWGESYKLRLGYNLTDSMTYVSIEISLAWGGGMQWQKPKTLLAKWAISMDLTPVKFVKKEQQFTF